MPQQITIDPDSPTCGSTDECATALSQKFGGDSKSLLETAGAVLQAPDGSYRYSTSVGGKDDSFQFSAMLPKGYKLAALVHTHPGADADGQVFSPNDLKTAQSLKIPSYVRFLNDNSFRRYQPGQTPTQNMNIHGSHFASKVAKGDPVADLAQALLQAKQP